MAKSQPPSSCLLAMPGEVRNCIYELLVVFPHPVCIYRKAQTSNNEEENEQIDLAATLLLPLFLTCRQLHLEGSAVFYSYNHFSLPRNASQLPRPVQTNLLFRSFLDRIGPRNAALLRHLAIPFPVDPDAFVRARRRHPPPSALPLPPSPLPPPQQQQQDEPAEEAETQPAHQDEGEEEYSVRYPTSLLPTLAHRCPNLETVHLTLDMRHDARWLVLLVPRADTAARPLFARLDGALHNALPALRRVRVALGATGQQPWDVDAGWAQLHAYARDPFGGTWAEALAGVLGEGEGGLGWKVGVVVPTPPERSGGGNGEHVDGDDVGGAAYEWKEPVGRDPSRFLYNPPEMVRSQVHDQWTRMQVLKFRLYYAWRWLRSPAMANQEKKEAREWREWRQAMLDRARTASLAMDCQGGGAPVSRRKRALSRVASLF